MKDSLPEGHADLRVADPAFRPSMHISFTFAGANVSALQGETIAAALAAAGVSRLGTRKDGSARGLWCGMGVCQECLVKVDRRPSVRACMATVADGMVVEEQGYAAALPAAPSGGVAAAPRTHRPRVLVVGAGPAGLSAARAAALSGAAVTMIDERSSPGGQYFKQIAESHDVLDEASLDAQARGGRDLIAEVERLGVTIVRGAALWGAFGANELAVTIEGEQHVFMPERLVLAAGVYERGVPVPGWTSPGFMTTGAAQTLLRAYRVKPGRRVLIAGNGPLNLQLAAELIFAGVEVAAVVEAATRPGARQAATLLAGFSRSPTLMRDGLRYLAHLRRANVAVLYGSAVVAARGRDRVEGCTVARIDAAGFMVSGTAVDYAVDTVCAGHGFLPSNEVARALGCRHAAYNGSLATITDGDGLTSVPGVYAIGDMVALAGAHAAQHQGFATGCAVARSLGMALPRRVADELVDARRRLRRSQGFQRALWHLFAAPVLRDQLAMAETVVCRCESVTCASIASALADGATTLGEVKRRTRCGMGRCQGRYCESIVAAMIGGAPRVQHGELSGLAPRAPIKPLRICDVA